MREGHPGMREFRAALATALLCLAAGATATGDTLSTAVARIAEPLGVPAGDISVWVGEIDRDAPLATINPDVPRTPASTMKLVTTFAALQGLGPAYRWQTEVHALGPIFDGVLHGDLLLRGQGDPYLVVEEFWKLTNGIHQTGLERIEGDLVFDSSHFDLPPESAAAFDGRPDRLYNLLPHPLLVNFNAMRFEFEPADGQVRIRTAPRLPNVELTNRLRIDPRRSCGGFQRGIALNVLAPPARDQVMLEGAFPAACERYALTRSVLQPESYAFGLFAKYWGQLGGELGGHWRTGNLAAYLLGEHGSASHGALGPSVEVPPTLLHVHHSRPLGELVRLINKYSNNVMTRHLELTLGAERFDPPATPAKGRAATLSILEQHGVDTRGLVIDNPAGLSRQARMSARQLAGLLLAAWDAPYMPEFVSSLALSGLDGTLRDRFAGLPEAGRMHLKTGTLDDVSAVAGYVQTPDNRRLIVVVMVNSPGAHRGPGEEIQDAVLRWAFRAPARAAAVP